jgi:hypothetical protein
MVWTFISDFPPGPPKFTHHATDEPQHSPIEQRGIQLNNVVHLQKIGKIEAVAIQ